jgi:hypothetical protein
VLELRLGAGAQVRQVQLGLKAQPVAAFFAEYKAALKGLGVEAKLWPMPVEVAAPVRFDRDTVERPYDRDAVVRFHRALMRVDAVLKRFATGFQGKISPVHFFWGSFDMAASRFSGRRAPERPGADKITKEAYSHEVQSVGWWPGGGDATSPMFYSYCAPEPAGFRESVARPPKAFFDTKLGEFLLSYDDVRASADPRAALLDFCQSTYEAAAINAKWDRESLERNLA